MFKTSNMYWQPQLRAIKLLVLTFVRNLVKLNSVEIYYIHLFTTHVIFLDFSVPSVEIATEALRNLVTCFINSRCLVFYAYILLFLVFYVMIKTCTALGNYLVILTCTFYLRTCKSSNTYLGYVRNRSRAYNRYNVMLYTKLRFQR